MCSEIKRRSRDAIGEEHLHFLVVPRQIPIQCFLLAFDPAEINPPPTAHRASRQGTQLDFRCEFPPQTTCLGATRQNFRAPPPSTPSSRKEGGEGIFLRLAQIYLFFWVGCGEGGMVGRCDRGRGKRCELAFC